MKEYIYGKNTVKEAMLSNKNVSKLYVTKNNEDFISLAKKKQIDFSIADNGYLNKLANGNHQGVVLEIEIAFNLIIVIGVSATFPFLNKFSRKSPSALILTVLVII